MLRLAFFVVAWIDEFEDLNEDELEECKLNSWNTKDVQFEALHLKHCHDSLSRMFIFDKFKHVLQCQTSHMSQHTPENSTCFSHDPHGKTLSNPLGILKGCKDTTPKTLQMVSINNVRVESMVYFDNNGWLS